jgi:plastocyanin
MAAVLLVVGLLSGLSGCGSTGGGDADDGGLAGSVGADDGGGGSGGEDELPEVEDAVVMEGTEVGVSGLDNIFRVAQIEVRPGTTVVWSNRGRNQHDVVPAEDDGWGVDAEGFQPGDSYSYTFDQAGTYHYYCSIHGTATVGMVGAVVVSEGDG